MKYQSYAGAVLAATSTLLTTVVADIDWTKVDYSGVDFNKVDYSNTDFSNGCSEEGGNWYCNPVDAISYSNFGTPGVFKKVSSMTNGACQSNEQSYGGGMAPMDGEVSWHFRGPLHLKQFAFYTPGTSSSKREVRATPFQRRHAVHNHHQHMHRHARAAEEKRGIPVTATINGDVVSWIMEDPTPAPAPVPAPAPAAVAPEAAKAVEAAPPAEPSEPAQPAEPIPSMNAGAGNWGRQAYYNAESGDTDGLVFLNHKGGQGSGVFDTTWGNSLSYASADGKTGSASPVPLADTLMDDSTEIVIMTDKACSGDCGTIRPGSVAYHGFDGPSKLFLVEFSMPMSGKRDWNSDMPAAWILNAEIPRTMQYGSCSCWESGCGEWDIFEVLDSGNTKCKSTWHGLKSLGDSNWFQRPTDKTQKAAVIFDGNASTGHIVLLPDDTTFDATVADTVVAGYLNSVKAPERNIRVALPV